MDDILRDYLNILNEISIKYESLLERYKLDENLSVAERRKLYDLFVGFEEMKLWGKCVLYADIDQPYENFVKSSSEMKYLKEMLMTRLELATEVSNKNNENDQVSVISRKVLPKICFLTRETFKDPVSHRYDASGKVENLCKHHIYEREALLKYLGAEKKKVCPIAGCSSLVVKAYLKKDQEVLDLIQSNTEIKKDSHNGIRLLD
ncbi:metal binding motif-containing protein [Cryptosporidium canis]|uniref:Metal binding motif-containing protein n=1 Tax=Cryptosporidium canis TaxID=195482 RepID=A0A9D5HXV1_9CRYT|nr:metal binding motif-containing protein [Cryptosporidium canis]